MKEGEYLTGLLYLEPSCRVCVELVQTPEFALNSVPYEALSPGAKGLEKILARYR